MAQDEVRAYLEANAQRFETDLMELLRIPTISADPSHRDDMRRGADWLVTFLTKIGLPRVELLPTHGVAPVVYAESPRVQGAPTVLVYGHYDVQPVDPLNEWERPPFEPVIENGRMYGRGTSDDKGQFMTHIFSTEAWMKAVGRAPVNLKFCFEGEEETSSQGLEELLEQEPERFACDVMAVSDMEQFAPGQPALSCGLRGISYCEVELTGPNRDLHSGTFGGAVTNPVNTLAKILANVVESHGRIQIPGFYDHVVDLSEEERKLLGELPFSEKTFFEEIGVAGGIGEEGYTPLERRWTRPTFDLNGIWGGFQGEGAKTVLPAKAGAKFSFRLVPNQDPKKVADAAQRWIADQLPVGITMKFTWHHGGRGVLTPISSPFFLAAADAVTEGFGTAPLYIRDGGSIPIIAKFAQIVDPVMVLIGLGLDMDRIHSPNESFSMEDFHRGIRTSALLWEKLAAVGKRTATV